jgi:multicomponent Na+:H+ antiporter subunit G
MSLLIADILVLLGVAGATVAVVGIARSRSGYVQIHASTLTVMVGALVVLAAALTTGDGAIIGRSLLAAGVLLLTTPVSGHAMARLQFFLDGGAVPPGSPSPDQPDGGGSHTNGASPV